MVYESFLSLFADVFGVIVLLIYDVLRRFVVMSKALSSASKNWMKRSPSILPSILYAYPGPSQSMQSHSIIDPPSNFTVPSTSQSLSPSPALFQTHFLPSDYTTPSQSSRVQFLYLIAKFILSRLCLCDRRGLFCFTTACYTLCNTALEL